MGKILVTGGQYTLLLLDSFDYMFVGNGFIAEHIILQLLEKGHNIVATVRTKEKAQKVITGLPETLATRISFHVVEDVGQPGAFGEVNTFFLINLCLINL
jgi:nucleoside-diphosphate-sugar epimerase